MNDDTLWLDTFAPSRTDPEARTHTEDRLRYLEAKNKQQAEQIRQLEAQWVDAGDARTLAFRARALAADNELLQEQIYALRLRCEELERQVALGRATLLRMKVAPK